MLLDHCGDMESEIGTLLADQLPRGQTWRWTLSGYAQGMLLHLMECMGFTAQFLPQLACADEAGGVQAISGFCFTAAQDGRTFSAYHPELGVAVVMAALMTLRTRPQMAVARTTY
jgi:hypothetical protein